MVVTYVTVHPDGRKKSRIRETPNLSIDADSSTNIFVSPGFKKGADSNLLSAPSLAPPPKGVFGDYNFFYPPPPPAVVFAVVAVVVFAAIVADAVVAAVIVVVAVVVVAAGATAQGFFLGKGRGVL